MRRYSIDTAAKQEAEEIRRFLAKSRSEKRYRAILKIVAEGKSRWSEIKKSLEILEGIEINDKNFNELLTRLAKAGFIEKIDEVYKVPDTIMTRAILKHL